jgi:PAS domain S-box-containing protein
MERFKNMSIKKKIFLFACLLVLLSSLGTALVARWIYVSNLESKIDVEGWSIAKTIGENSKGLLMAGDVPQLTTLIHNTIRTAQRAPSILYVAVVNHEGNLLTWVFPDSLNEQLPQAKTILPQAPRTVRDLRSGYGSSYTIIFPVREGPRPVGFIYMGLSRKGIDELIARSTRTLSLFVVAMVILLVGVSYWISKPMTRRISELTKLSDEISRGHLDLPRTNADPIKCWELKKCEELECSAYDNTDIPCWYIDQTLGCGAGLSGCFPDKVRACYGCDVYQNHVGDELVQLERSLRNMTIRLRSSEAGLRESEKKYRSLFDSGPNPVFVVDKKSVKIIDANQSAQKTYEYSKEELIGKSFSDLGPFEYGTAPVSDPERGLSPRGYTSSQKVRHYKRGKKPFYVNVHSCPVLYGEKEAIIIVTTDITEMMEKDAQLIQACKMTSLGEMSAGIAHELNQPLNAINLGNVFLKKMIDENKEIPREDFHEIVKEGINQVNRAAEIINRLREFGRKTEFVKEKVEINKPIHNVFAIIGRQLSLENIKVQLELEEAPPPILAHNNRLEQVIFNLVTNARDAISQRQKAGAGSDDRIIKVRSYTEGDRVAVTVSDTGIGIPDDARDKVFEPFFTTKEAGKGMGLGLSIAYGIVKDYDGDIHVEGKENEGAIFKLTFPVARDKDEEDSGIWIKYS